MIGLLLLAVGLCAMVTAIIALHLSGDTRSAADPDKETPPKGWTDPRTAETAVIERKPAICCARCGKPVADGETVWMHPATDSVYHILCYELRRTIRA